LVIALRRIRMTSALIARRLKMPPATVKRIVARAGLNRLPSLEPPEPVIRYERSRPGELIHLDTKKLARIGRPGHLNPKNARERALRQLQRPLALDANPEAQHEWNIDLLRRESCGQHFVADVASGLGGCTQHVALSEIVAGALYSVCQELVTRVGGRSATFE
jgi:hypothetical protein